jgi:hypothetical protein
VAAAAADKVAKDNPVVVRRSATAQRGAEADSVCASQAAGLELAAPNVSRFLKKLLGLNNKVKQRFFPQCNGCSSVRPARRRRRASAC